MEVIRRNLGVQVYRYVQVDYADLRKFVDLIGGVDVELTDAIGARYPAGRHHLDGKAALAFIRHRKGGDDFGRMRRLQEVFLPAVIEKVRNDPGTWPKVFLFACGYLLKGNYDGILAVAPHIFLTTYRAGKVKGSTLSRGMARPVKARSRGGALVLCPRWKTLAPRLKEVFHQDFISIRPPAARECVRQRTKRKHS
jgi:hypothetical protein